jgi:glycosyltransferase involved in cell wall biosynthesis
MAAHVPVLVASSADHDLLVCHGQRGRVFTPAGARPLAAELEQALVDGENGQRMADNALAYVRQDHRLDRMAQQYLQLFESVLRSSRRTVP